MATNLNLDSLVVDANGRASFSGLSTGIDFQNTVNGLMAAKRIPVDSIEQRISKNEARVAVLENIETLTRNLHQAVDQLRGSPSFDGSRDIFEAKEAFAGTSRADAQTPSAAAELVGVVASNRAQATGHTVEVLQVATAHKIASDSISLTLTDPLGETGTFELNGTAITLDGSESLLDLRDKINAADSGANGTGVTASIVSIAADQQVLVLTADDTGADAAITLADTSGTALENLGVLNGAAIKNELKGANNAQIEVDGLEQVAGVSVIERQNNTIDDVIEGVTLTLFMAEPETTINLEVDRDLNSVKSAIADVVDAYNELRTFLNTQSQTEIENEDGETVSGVLAGTRVLSEVRARLGAGIGTSVAGDSPTLSVLAEIGITLRSSTQVADPLAANTLAIDEAKLDDALLNDTDAVRGLFSFDFSSSSTDVLLVGFSEKTSYSATGYTLNVAYSGGQIVSANIDGASDGSDDGSVVVDGQRLSVVSGGAEGLELLYTGAAAASGIQLGVEVGIGAQLHGVTTGLLDGSTGLLSNEIDLLSDQNAFAQSRVDRMNERLERQREKLLERFAAMESALASMNSLLDSLRQQIDSSFGNNN
jgi:flagellar hook-associated protein 2